MSRAIDRRTFITGAASLAQIASGQDERMIRIGVVGVGNRGTSLLRTLLALPGVDVPAICDINEANLARAQGLVEKTAASDPRYAGVEDFLKRGSRPRCRDWRLPAICIRRWRSPR